jgi:thiol-disulfide isomerase/thioredoxin
MQVAAALIGLVAVATVLGLLWRASQGRVAPARGKVSGVELGGHATLLQLSSELCAPCRSTARVLAAVATEGVRHIEIDIAHRPDLAAQFNVLQTPTTLILDSAGAVRSRIGGAVRREVIEAELLRVLVA